MAESPSTSSYPTIIDSWNFLTDKEDLAEVSDINKIKDAILETQNVLKKTTDRVGTSNPPSPVEGDIFYRSDTNTLQTYDGSSWNAITSSGKQVFTADRTFTAPTGVTQVLVTLVGGGGGGYNSGLGGGGGGGQALVNFPFTVTAGNNYTVTVGDGGAVETDGEASSFDTLSVLPGKGSTSSTGGLGGGKTTSVHDNDGTTNRGAGARGVPGGNGGDGATNIGGGGGGTLFGVGGLGASDSSNNSTAGAANTGGGGGGRGTTGAYGKAGGSGIVIVTW